ncbi:hypothetical protein ACFQL7_22325 [Halocatena marina]|uniref:Uncharacterized protein n=1 Tax=Halocatena marina TaxID=2934937 RepID=A0ABD5YXP1_9EURY
MANDDYPDSSIDSLLNDLLGVLTNKNRSCRGVDSDHREFGWARVGHEFSIGIGTPADSESDSNEQVGDSCLSETRRRHKATLSTLDGAKDEAETGGNRAGTIRDRLCLSNPFRRVNIAISSLSGGDRIIDSSEAIQVQIQSRLIDQINEFIKSSLNVRLNNVYERTEKLFDVVDRLSVRIQQPTHRCPRRLLRELSGFRQSLRRDNIRLRKTSDASTVTELKSIEVMPMSNQSDIND